MTSTISAATRLIDEVRKLDPVTRRVRLADIAEIYGRGFAEHLGQQLRDEDNGLASTAAARRRPARLSSPGKSKGR